MPLQKLKLKPGVYKDSTQYQAEGAWYDADKVRFLSGRPEKIGGWQKVNGSSAFPMIGKARRVFTWRAISTQIFTAIGTSQKLYVYTGGTFYNITPYRHQVTGLTNPFTTVSGSSTVTVTDSGFGSNEGDWITMGAAYVVNGLTLSGDYQIVTVIDANNYTITAAGVASGSGAGGGTVAINYEINIGLDYSVPSVGWGVGPWGAGSWGTPRDSDDVSDYNAARVWTLDNYGQTLIANPFAGSIYRWDPTDQGVDDRAVLLDAAAPVQCNTFFIANEAPHIVACGCTNIGDEYDPHQIRWCDATDYSQWVGSSTNTAGGLVIQGGARIVSAMPTRGQYLVWTDQNCHLMQYISTPLQFNIQMAGVGAGIVGPAAAAELAGVMYWIGRNGFYQFDGSVKFLATPNFHYVYNALDFNQGFLCSVSTVREFNEVIFLYPTTDTIEVSKYMLYDTFDTAWVNGSFVRLAWQDSNEYGHPLATDADGYLYYHEYGADADGAAMNSFIESAYVDISDGDRIMFTDRWITDFTLTGTATALITSLYYPAGPAYTRGPFTITPSTQKIDYRSRGRLMSMKIASTSLATTWSLGDIVMNIQADGQR